MANPLYVVEQLPTTSAAAIREFNDRYIAGIGAGVPSTWVSQYGEVGPTNSPHVTFPISALGLKYQKTMGENRFKTLAEASFDLKVSEFDEGIEAPLLDLFTQTYAYRKWQQGPQRLLLAEQRFLVKSIATLLEAGETTDLLWENAGGSVEFFDDSHPCNFADSSLGTWSNLATGTTNVVSVTNIETQVTAMQGQVKDEQGDVLGVDPDVIIVPTAKYEPLRNLLKKEMIAGAGTESESNPYLGKFTVVHAPELTDANDWYLVDSKLLSQGLPPWIALRYAPPTSLGLRNYDESSDFFKDTGRIKVSSHIWYGFCLAFPHAIRKVPGA